MKLPSLATATRLVHVLKRQGRAALPIGLSARSFFLAGSTT